MKTLIGLAALILAGCACLEPDTVRVEGEHLSHTSQHLDGSHQDIGAELVAVQLHWQHNGAYLNVSEGYNLSNTDGYRCDGGLCGNHEVFQAAIGYEFPLK